MMELLKEKVKVLFSSKCGKWFKHKIIYKNGFGYRRKYCDRTKSSCRRGVDKT